MRKAMDDADISGTIVIGEGERDKAPMLYIGEQVGNPDAAVTVDIAVDPLEGTNLVATGSSRTPPPSWPPPSPAGSCTPRTRTSRSSSSGPRWPARSTSTIRSPRPSSTIADALGRKVWDITVVILDRPRHEELIADVRATGARIKLIGDGDLTAAISRRGLGHRRPCRDGDRRRAGGRPLRRGAQVPGRRDPGAVQVALRRGEGARPQDGRRRRRHRARVLHRTTSPRATTSSSAPPA